MDTAASNMLARLGRPMIKRTEGFYSLTLLYTIVRRLCSFNVKDPNDSTP